jgi:hypothetical protein
MAGSYTNLTDGPSWLDPGRGGTGMTYHPPTRWNRDGTVQSAARGQEFVADMGDRADAIAWILQVLKGEI